MKCKLLFFLVISVLSFGLFVFVFLVFFVVEFKLIFVYIEFIMKIQLIVLLFVIIIGVSKMEWFFLDIELMYCLNMFFSFGVMEFILLSGFIVNMKDIMNGCVLCEIQIFNNGKIVRIFLVFDLLGVGEFKLKLNNKIFFVVGIYIFCVENKLLSIGNKFYVEVSIDVVKCSIFLIQLCGCN